jgi:hypothetical protein
MQNDERGLRFISLVFIEHRAQKTPVAPRGRRFFSADIRSLALAAELFLNPAHRRLGFALELLGGVTFDGTNHIVGFAPKLLRLTCTNVFTSHGDLRVKAGFGTAKNVPKDQLGLLAGCSVR